jgi:AcrR family transcriptional regulator
VANTNGTTTTKPRRTQVERRDEAEQALLDAAQRLFARQGIDQTTLVKIGEEAGYSRGLVHYHFGSKAALVERLAERTQRGFLEGLTDLGDGDEIDAAVAVADAYLAFARDADDEARALFVMWGAALPRQAGLRTVFTAGAEWFRAGIEALVQVGQGHGTIGAEVDPAGFAVAFVGLLRGVATQHLVEADGVDLEAARAACERFVRSALAAPRR